LPFFLTFHGDDMNTWPDSHPDRIADLRAAVSDASGVFAVSHALAERVRDVTGLDATVLPLGSDHDWIASSSPPRDDARQSIGLPEDRIVVLFVGYLTREKGVRELASAILDLGEPFVGVFVGEGPELGFGSDDPRAQGRLVFPGAMAHGDVIRYMSAADVLLLPSYGEGLPTVLVEAGSVGLPVIASAVGGIPELLGQDRGVLLPEVSASAIASALTDFRERRADATLDAARLREHVREAYDVNTNARRLLEHYRAADRTGGGT
jgi:teichuronic acid biosynthesis glycosyltransferase TuaC